MQIKYKVLCFTVCLLSLSCSEKGSGNHFYVKFVNGVYIYHSNKSCSKLDGTFDEFDYYKLCDEKGNIAPYDFCSRCMDDEFIEKCKSQIVKESTPYTSVFEEDGLTFYYPKFSSIDLVCGTMPSIKDKNVLFCAEAAFTGELLKEFKHSNILGDHVSGGIKYHGTSNRRNTGAFVYYNGTYKFVNENLDKELYLAAAKGGMGFCQEMMIHEGKRMPTIRKDANKNEFRALCDRYGRLYVIDSKGVSSFGDFIDNLLKAGVTEALYLDMGSGWNYSWWRDDQGIAHEIHSHRIAFTTNWITFYK